MIAKSLEVSHDLLRQLQGRLSPRPDNALTGPLGYPIPHLLQRHLYATLKLCIAEATAQITFTQANEYRGSPHIQPLSL